MLTQILEEFDKKYKIAAIKDSDIAWNDVVDEFKFTLKQSCLSYARSVVPEERKHSVYCKGNGILPLFANHQCDCGAMDFNGCRSQILANIDKSQLEQARKEEV